jgi:hypothetical protein
LTKKNGQNTPFGRLERPKLENRSSVKAKNCFWFPKKVSSLPVKKSHQRCPDSQFQFRPKRQTKYAFLVA